ncbi:MAG: hypothetical protein JNM14_13315 [Ferruginibacter sp.]|nr:hypothetical protein [Ferruginibacter sp.]
MAGIAKILFPAVFFFTASIAFAQKPKPATAKPAGFQKYTPPRLTSMLGIRSGDSVSVLLEEAVQLVKLPLKVTDDKKNVYTVTSYQALYKKRGVTESEDMSGKTSPTFTTVIDNFKTTPLPLIWIKTLTETLRTGEELFFFDIVVKDAQGRLMFAPNLRIKVK